MAAARAAANYNARPGDRRTGQKDKRDAAGQNLRLIYGSMRVATSCEPLRRRSVPALGDRPARRTAPACGRHLGPRPPAARACGCPSHRGHLRASADCTTPAEGRRGHRPELSRGERLSAPRPRSTAAEVTTLTDPPAGVELGLLHRLLHRVGQLGHRPWLLVGALGAHGPAQLQRDQKHPFVRPQLLDAPEFCT